MNKKVLAIDFGASSGRAIIGSLADGKISFEEIHRFSNDPVIVNGCMYWDVLRLYHEIKQSIVKAKKYGEIESIGIDTWGVDFGIIDKHNRLMANPFHYRDNRTNGMSKWAKTLVSDEKLYSITGIQSMEINTFYQLLALKKQSKTTYYNINKMLMMPDLFNYFLTGNMFCEQTIASSTQMLDARTKDWSPKIISLVGNEEMFPKIIKPSTTVGTLTKEICEELDVKPSKVVAVCSHDTESALVSVPATDSGDVLFLSSGTWSLFGTETDCPVTNETAFKYNVSNETGFNGSTVLLKNLTGLWIIQETRRWWIKEGKEYSFADMEQMAKDSKPFQCFIDTDYADFAKTGNIPQYVKDYCKKTNQYVPQTDGEVIRCIYESLAMKYRVSFEEIKAVTGKTYDKLYIVGGGTKDKFLSSMACNSCNLPVVSGPSEATALGNIAVQFIALNEIKDVTDARQIIKNSETLNTFEPTESEVWQKAYKKYLEVL